MSYNDEAWKRINHSIHNEKRKLLESSFCEDMIYIGYKLEITTIQQQINTLREKQKKYHIECENYMQLKDPVNYIAPI